MVEKSLFRSAGETVAGDEVRPCVGVVFRIVARHLIDKSSHQNAHSLQAATVLCRLVS